MTPGTPGFVGRRLRESREAYGLSVTALAELVDVSKQAISRYESGEDSPRPEVFERICVLFKHEPHFLLRPYPKWIESPKFFRSLASSTKGARLKAEARHSWMREIVNYLSEFVVLPAANFPSTMPKAEDPNALSLEQVERSATGLRQFWNLGDGPVPNLTRAMEQNGIVVLRHPLDAETLDGVSAWAMPEGIPYVLLNSDKNCAARSRLDLAHELGHLCIHQAISETTLNRKEMFMLIEQQAFRFGAAFLLPEKAFLEDVYSISLDALKVLKRKWRVSIAMMIERLKNLEIIDQDQHRRLRIAYASRKWTKEEPFDRELAIEQPSLIQSAFRTIADSNVQRAEQIIANSGFSRHWLEHLLAAPTSIFEDDVKVEMKVLEFKRRA
jgi:Zn-dependent peptidase ImmA (M78 family)/transcriptional regulator with XRE-family HTH domain